MTDTQLKELLSDNISADSVLGFITVYRIEVLLRELIVSQLSEIDGAHWYKRRLPGDILNDFKKGVEYDRQRPWRETISFHPIYYIDFGSIKKIIEKRDNWDDCFKKIFSNKIQIVSGLELIEPIRNSIAHNRQISLLDKEKLDSFYSELTNCIGVEKSDKLLSSNTKVESLMEKLEQLAKDVPIVKKSMDCCSSNLPIIESTSYFNEWWFDSDYLLHDVSPIKEFGEIISWYYSLDRKRGDGHDIQKELRNREYDAVFDECDKCLNSIIGE